VFARISNEQLLNIAMHAIQQKLSTFELYGVVCCIEFLENLTAYRNIVMWEA